MSGDKENWTRKQNEMTADIEKLIRHNEELLSIKDELKARGVVSNANRFLNSNTQFGGGLSSSDSERQNPRPMLFVRI